MDPRVEPEDDGVEADIVTTSNAIPHSTGWFIPWLSNSIGGE